MLGAIGSVIGGLGGLFGSKKKKDPTPRENLLSQAQGAREAAEKYGFNPLTMLQYGQAGGAASSGGGTSPLASIALITDGLQSIDDERSGENARRRQAQQLQNDLAQIQLDQLRSGVIIQDRTARQEIGSSPSPLGRNTVTYVPGDTGTAYPRLTTNRSVAGDYPNRDHPLATSSGAISVPDPTIDRGAGTFVAGTHLEAPPGWSTGEHIEQEFGENPIVSWPYSGALATATLGHNARRALGISVYPDEDGTLRLGRTRTDRPKKNPRAKYRERGTGPIWPDYTNTQRTR